MTGEPVFRIVTGARGDPDGGDSMLLPVPPGWYADLGHGPALIGPVVRAALAELSERGAAACGERLHHADWVLTTDPAVVERAGMTHDCAECRAGTDRALAFLRANPGREVACGMLYWAQP